MKNYIDGEIIEICNGKKYMLHFQKSKLQHMSAKLIAENAIKIKIPANYQQIEIYQLLRKILAKDNINWLKNYILKLNNLHFGFDYKNIELKNFKRRFGHCTSKNEIAICSRLLFTAIEFLEYVVIHELAHVKEKNHGKNFWNLVYKACPDYKTKRKTLKNFNF